jgi:hypothetical protein
MTTYVTLPFRPYREPLNWAKENCPSYISNDVHMDGYNSYDNTKIDYFFGNEEDAMLFKLAWL